MRVDCNAFLGAYPWRKVPGTSPEQLLSAMDRAGILTQSAPRRFIQVLKRVQVALGDAFGELRPHANGFRAEYAQPGIRSRAAGVDPLDLFPPVWLLHLGIFVVFIPAMLAEEKPEGAGRRSGTSPFPHAPMIPALVHAVQPL